jgi:diguanylate cyclase (GGDEF)-like protein/PAS domain S-box-containing protein
VGRVAEQTASFPKSRDRDVQHALQSYTGGSYLLDAMKMEEEESLGPASGRSREQLALALRLSEERFRTFMNNAPFLAFIKDADGRFLFYNDRMAHRFGITPDAWLGKNDFEIWPREIAATMHANDLDVMAAGESIDRLEETIEKDGTVATWKVHKFTWRNELGETLLGGIGLDLTEELTRERALAEANLQLQQLATTDGLTGLANRRVLDERVEYEYRLAKRHKTELSVVLMDLDNFKRRNDVYGHASGDEVLRRLGYMVTSILRVTDLAARYGGEELVIVLPGAGSEGSMIFTERLKARMREADWPDEPLTASFGIATLVGGIPSGRRLIELADWAMYEAKRAGKDRIVAYEEVARRLRSNAQKEEAENLGGA